MPKSLPSTKFQLNPASKSSESSRKVFCPDWQIAKEVLASVYSFELNFGQMVTLVSDHPQPNIMPRWSTVC